MMTEKGWKRFEKYARMIERHNPESCIFAAYLEIKERREDEAWLLKNLYTLRMNGEEFVIHKVGPVAPRKRNRGVCRMREILVLQAKRMMNSCPEPDDCKSCGLAKRSVMERPNSSAMRERERMTDEETNSAVYRISSFRQV